jgi:two-component system response regulator HydG
VLLALSRPSAGTQRMAFVAQQAVPRPAPQSVETAMAGDDPALRQALELARASAPTRNPVLIVGQPGTGKSLLARIIHELSPRRNAPFIEVSCRPRHDGSLEDELFGGWCDGNGSERPGKLARAHGGTLVLDDVNALSPALQLKLHMVLHDGRIETVSTTRVVRVDVRLILTGSGSGLGEALLGRFWQHVYGENSTTTLRLPPLRERGTDVIKLAELFLARTVSEAGHGPAGFTPEALGALARYPWPGNVAELRSVIRKAAGVAQSPRIAPQHLSLSAGANLPPAAALRSRRNGAAAAGRVQIIPLRDALAEPEKWLILRALQVCNWNRQETADVLVINRATLEKKMKKYGLFSASGPVLRDASECAES